MHKDPPINYTTNRAKPKARIGNLKMDNAREIKFSDYIIDKKMP